MEKSMVRNRRYKSVSIKLYEEEGHVLSDVLVVQHNMITDNTSMYDAINFRKKMTIFIAICKRFYVPRRMAESSKITKNKIRELMEKDPNISSSEIRRVTGCSFPIIDRYYMTLKRVYKR